MNDTLIEISASEIEAIEGGNNGTYCGLAVGAAVALAVLFGPETLFFTGGKVAAICIVENV